MPYIRGRVERVLHQSGTYFVLAVRVDETDFPIRDTDAKVSGHICGLPKIRSGVTIQIVGDWVNHPKWGRQFSPRGWFPWAKSVHDIPRFLNECVTGFEDWNLCKLVSSAFDKDTFDVLSREPNRVHELLQPEDPLRTALSFAVLQWEAARALSDLSLFLQDYELGPEAVTGVFAKFGRDAIQIIRDNPYRLIAVDRFDFAKADRIAMRMGISHNDPRRLQGAVLWLIRIEAQQGHLYVKRGDFIPLLRSMEEGEHIEPFVTDDLNGDILNAIRSLHEQGAIRVDPVGAYLPELFNYERQAAVKLAEFTVPSKIEVDLDFFLTDYQRSNHIELSEAQREAVRQLVENRVLVLTGLPGTGKTTTIRTFVRLFKSAGIAFKLMAPTGIAAKRLASVTGEEAGTIHRTFGYTGDEWGFDSTTKFSTGAVIVDEMSMVDQELFFRIVDALHPSTMLVLVGDDAQLPSVGPGNVLRELIACPEIPNVRLTQIFRQAETSDIVVASHKINKGSSPIPDVRQADSEFQFVPIADEERIVEFIVEAAGKLKARDANFQVLSPKYDGVIGVNNLNERLRDKLNPAMTGQEEWKAGSLYVREGDRLMVIKNNYDLNVYNGDMGKLVSISKTALTLRIHGIGAGAVDTHVDIPKTDAPDVLKLAYAITVHKSQGSEFDTILMPIVRTQGRMLQRNLFYTGVTRARKKVWLLGDVNSVLKAVANDKVVQRNTVFGRAVSDEVKRLTAGVVGAPEASDERERQEEPVRPPDTGATREVTEPLG